VIVAVAVIVIAPATVAVHVNGHENVIVI